MSGIGPRSLTKNQPSADRLRRNSSKVIPSIFVLDQVCILRIDVFRLAAI